jgi:GPH family glycoside/pentoside/hexuronide:cation symporter
VNGFIGKVGMAVASSVAAAMLAASGYVANAPVQSASALNAISAMYIWIPIAANVLTIVTFLFYDLDKKLPDINRELEARRKEN